MTDPPSYDSDDRMQPGEWGDYGIGYYDRSGRRMTMERFSELHRDPDYKRIAQTYIGKLWVSTVWLGMNHRFAIDEGEGPPLIFESMVFYDDQDGPWSHTTNPDDRGVLALHTELQDYIGEPFRYATEEEATRGHDLLCNEIRVLIAKIEMAQQVHDAAVDEQARKALRRKDKD